MREREHPLVATVAFLNFLDDLYRAAMAREREAVRTLLRQPLSIRVPAEVRAEALAIAGAPRASLRAPIHLLQLRQRVIELAIEDREGSATPPDQLELPLARRGRSIRVC